MDTSGDISAWFWGIPSDDESDMGTSLHILRHNQSIRELVILICSPWKSPAECRLPRLSHIVVCSDPDSWWASYKHRAWHMWILILWGFCRVKFYSFYFPGFSTSLFRNMQPQPQNSNQQQSHLNLRAQFWWWCQWPQTWRWDPWWRYHSQSTNITAWWYCSWKCSTSYVWLTLCYRTC